MSRSYRWVFVWLWFALIGWAVFLLLVGVPAWTLWLGGNESGPGSSLVVSGALIGWIALAALGTAWSRRLEPKGGALNPLERFTGIVRWILLGAVLALVTRGALHLLPEGDDLALGRHLDRWFEPALAALSSAGSLARIPPSVAGVAVAPVALFVLVVLTGNALRWRLDRLRQMERTAHAPVTAGARRETEEDDEVRRSRALAAERKVALSSYAEARSVLKGTEMKLTFLSLDIVGSTKMKEGEDPYVIEQSFGDYRKLVERALRNHGAYKQTWTPDGQMAAFRSPAAAVACAQEVFRGLPAFNREVSKLRVPFRLRAGAHSGTVSTDDETPMEAISDASIDVAGHLQKYADPGSLWISEDLFWELSNPDGFEEADRQVDGKRVFCWLPEGDA